MMLTLVQVMNFVEVSWHVPLSVSASRGPRVLESQTPTSVSDLTTSFCDIALVELGGKAGSSGPFHCGLKWAQYSHDDVLSHVAQIWGSEIR